MFNHISGFSLKTCGVTETPHLRYPYKISGLCHSRNKYSEIIKQYIFFHSIFKQKFRCSKCVVSICISYLSYLFTYHIFYKRIMNKRMKEHCLHAYIIKHSLIVNKLGRLIGLSHTLQQQVAVKILFAFFLLAIADK